MCADAVGCHGGRRLFAAEQRVPRAGRDLPCGGGDHRWHSVCHSIGPDQLRRRGAGLHRSRQGLQRRLYEPGYRWRYGHPAGEGYVRAGSPLIFPTHTTKASTIFPDLDQYRGKPLDYGRMEQTVSDPHVVAQMGMRVGIPNAGQLNALETLNIRGERSVTCKGAFDAHPSNGPLPGDAPPGCDAFRQQPDALERAAELDAQYGQPS